MKSTPNPYSIQVRRHKAEIEQTLDALGRSVYSRSLLEDVLREYRPIWKMSRVPFSEIFDRLLAESHLAQLDLTSRAYGTLVRFAWRAPSPFEVAQSLRPQSYLTHTSAVFLHGLTDDIPAVFFSNREQSAKHFDSRLTQESIDRAFSGTPRESNYVFSDNQGRRFIGLNGKWTGALEVVEGRGPSGEALRLTGLERTLIDITVRPHYCGGVARVLHAFEAARERVSANLLVATLKRIQYVYPYHQAIGFLMERTGYSGRALDLVRRLPRDVDFYLAHGLKEKAYDKSWRLYYPLDL